MSATTGAVSAWVTVFTNMTFAPSAISPSEYFTVPVISSPSVAFKTLSSLSPVKLTTGVRVSVAFLVVGAEELPASSVATAVTGLPSFTWFSGIVAVSPVG